MAMIHVALSVATLLILRNVFSVPPMAIVALALLLLCLASNRAPQSAEQVLPVNESGLSAGFSWGVSALQVTRCCDSSSRTCVQTCPIARE
eukprot:2345471-Pleurochrysis_carterae.AAC.6